MGKLKSPKSTRAAYSNKIGNRTVVSKLKITTGDHLGLKKVPDLVAGKKGHEVPGSKGTKSFQLVFKSKITIGGVTVQRLAFPVDGKVTVRQFYTYARKAFSSKGVGAIITPDGILKAWDKITRSGGGLIPKLPGLPDLPSLPGFDLSNLVPDGTLPAIGGYLGNKAFGPVGGAIGSLVGDYLDG